MGVEAKALPRPRNLLFIKEISHPRCLSRKI